MFGSAPVKSRRIVVGFDGSASARAALGWAVEEARLRGGLLEVWAAVESRRLGIRVGSGEMLGLPDLRAAAERVAKGTGAGLRVSRGAAATVLSEACDTADLLVVGSRGRNPVAGLLLGSVSHACLVRAPCTVVVVGPTPTPPRPHGRVVVGLGASDEARLALLVGVREAQVRAAELEAIHALAWNQLHDPGLILPATRQLLAWAGDLVSEALADSGVAGRSCVINGNPTDVLVRHSVNADLLVLASRGRRPLTKRALGSTTDFCARHAKCPVMIVHPDALKTNDVTPP